MYTQKLIQIQEIIRKKKYVMTSHARKEMNYDDFSIFDIERGILTGKILERQKDKAKAEWKFRIKGKTILSDDIEIICKISPTNKLVIITVYKP